MIRTGTCPACGQPVALKPKARLTTACSAECRRVLVCRKATRFREANPEAARATQQRHAKTDKRAASSARWQSSKRAEWDRQYFAARPNARIARSLRARISNVLGGLKKSAPTLSYLGCSVAEFRAHLERQFKPGMTWENHGRTGWHIDHKRPLASFSLVKPDGTLDEIALRSALHFSNLQPLWYWENIAKADHLEIAGETIP